MRSKASPRREHPSGSSRGPQATLNDDSRFVRLDGIGQHQVRSRVPLNNFRESIAMLAQFRTRAGTVFSNQISARFMGHGQPCAGKTGLSSFLPLLVAAILFATQADGGEFRVETTVFRGEENRTVDRRTTLFRDAQVVDLSSSGLGEVNLLDHSANELVVIDETTQHYSRVSASQIAQLLWAQDKRIPPKLQSVLARLEPTWNSQQNVLTLANVQLNYTATLTKPASSTIAKAYREFTDWMARFNAISPGRLPPMPRLQLNEQIAIRGLVPSEIRKTVSLDVVTKARTTHQFFPNWRDQDHKRVDQILQAYPRYEEMDLHSFLTR